MKFSKKYERIKIKHIKRGCNPYKDAFISDCRIFSIHCDGFFWTLTHLPTGHAFGVSVFESAKKARGFAKEIKPLLDWKKVKVKVTSHNNLRKTKTILPDGVDQSVIDKIKEIRGKYL